VCDPGAARSSSRSTCAPSPSSTSAWQRLERELHEEVKGWRLYPVVEAIQALRGVDLRAPSSSSLTGGPHAVRHSPAADELSRPHAPRSTPRGKGDGKAASPRQGTLTRARAGRRRVGLSVRAKVSRHLQLRLEKLPAEVQAIA